MICADMAMAGIKSVVPFEEVVTSADMVGRCLPASLRETGIGGIPVVYDGSLADGILVCDDEDAFKMMRELSFKEGILAGISSGATFKAALDYSKENANKGLRIVVLSTDSGEKYLSNAYNY